MKELMHIDYGKLSEQYASFLYTLGSVSITVLTLVVSLAPRRRRTVKSLQNKVNYRPHLIAALTMATVICFVGAQLMAETASFINSFPVGQAPPMLGSARPLGERLFLIASINIYIAVTVVIFALMLLTAEYKMCNEEVRGVRRFSMFVFVAVVLCIFCWMIVSATRRMPMQNWVYVVLPIVVVLVLTFFSWNRWKKSLGNWLVPVSFISIICFTVMSLGWFTYSLHWDDDRVTTDIDLGFFISVVFSTSVFLGAVGKRLIWNEQNASLWPMSRKERHKMRREKRQRDSLRLLGVKL